MSEQTPSGSHADGSKDQAHCHERPLTHKHRHRHNGWLRKRVILVCQQRLETWVLDGLEHISRPARVGPHPTRSKRKSSSTYPKECAGVTQGIAQPLFTSQ